MSHHDTDDERVHRLPDAPTPAETVRHHTTRGEFRSDAPAGIESIDRQPGGGDSMPPDELGRMGEDAGDLGDVGPADLALDPQDARFGSG